MCAADTIHGNGLSINALGSGIVEDLADDEVLGLYHHGATEADPLFFVCRSEEKNRNHSENKTHDARTTELKEGQTEEGTTSRQTRADTRKHEQAQGKHEHTQGNTKKASKQHKPITKNEPTN